MSKFQCSFRRFVAEPNPFENRLFLPNVTIPSVFVDQPVGLGARVVAGSSNGSLRCAVIAPPRPIRRTDIFSKRRPPLSRAALRLREIHSSRRACPDDRAKKEGQGREH